MRQFFWTDKLLAGAPAIHENVNANGLSNFFPVISNGVRNLRAWAKEISRLRSK